MTTSLEVSPSPACSKDSKRKNSMNLGRPVTVRMVSLARSRSCKNNLILMRQQSFKIFCLVAMNGGTSKISSNSHLSQFAMCFDHKVLQSVSLNVFYRPSAIKANLMLVSLWRRTWQMCLVRLPKCQLKLITRSRLKMSLPFWRSACRRLIYSIY